MAVYIAALASIPLKAAPLISLLLSPKPNLRAHVPTLVHSLLIVVPYVVILFRRQNSKEKNRLALAVGWGTINFLLSWTALLRGLSSGKPLIWALLAALVQVTLVVAALKGYLRMGREPRDWKRLSLGCVKALIYFVLMTLAVGLSA